MFPDSIPILHFQYKEGARYIIYVLLWIIVYLIPVPCQWQHEIHIRQYRRAYNFWSKFFFETHLRWTWFYLIECQLHGFLFDLYTNYPQHACKSFQNSTSSLSLKILEIISLFENQPQLILRIQKRLLLRSSQLDRRIQNWIQLVFLQQSVHQDTHHHLFSMYRIQLDWMRLLWFSNRQWFCARKNFRNTKLRR